MSRHLSWQKIILWVTLYSIAMGFLESAVVIYLRALYYPNGFSFPLILMNTNIVLTELVRETATIVMLLSIGFIAGRNFAQRFAYFIFSFAVWDISYYVFLKVILNWPSSLMTWDVLFLIPVYWTSPVIAPIIVSLTMIVLSLLLIIKDEKNLKITFEKSSWILLIAGSITIMLSFTWDYLGYMLSQLSLMQICKAENKDLVLKTSTSYIPGSFNWLIFIVGEILIFVAIRNLYYASSRLKSK
jgi:hypothetical protein